jgi:hypothetical protein
VLHHVSLEVHPDDAGQTIELLELIGFRRIQAPEPIAEYVDWVEREGTHVHLIRTPEPTIMPLGHAAFVAPDYDATLGAVRKAGFEVEEAGELWDEPRAFAVMPSGQRIELMAAPPPPAS